MCQYFQCLDLAACADWHFGWADAGCGLVLKEAFDDTVFQRMEGNDGDDSVGCKKFHCGFERVGEFFEFVVDGDSESLERACGGGKAMLMLEADELLQKFIQFSCGLPRLLLASFDDFPCDGFRLELPGLARRKRIGR